MRQPHIRIQLLYPWMAWRDGCDVFHVNYYGPVLGLRNLVVTFHDVLYLDFPAHVPLLRRLQFRALGRLTAWAAARIVTDSEYAASRIVHHFGVSPTRIRVIYPGLSAAWHMPDEKAIAGAWHYLRRKVPARFILTVGRLEPRKNFGLCARVTRVLKEQGLIDGLVIAGPDDFGTPEFQREIQAAGLESIIVRLTDLSVVELQAMYRHSSGVLFLSLAEGFGFPPLEAMSMGTPVVVSNRTSMPEVCGDAALLVDPSDEGAVTTAVARILTEAPLRSTLVERGYRRKADFSALRMARATVEVYEEVAQQSKLPRPGRGSHLTD